MPGAEPMVQAGREQRDAVGVLLVHGLTATPQMVRPVAEHLAGLGYAVSAPRLPGHGTSWRHLSRTRYADWLAAVLRAVEDLQEGRRRVVAFGVSLGGALVTDLALRRPDLLSGLVLVNPAFATEDRRLRLLPVLRMVLPFIEGIADDIRRPGPPRELAYRYTPVPALASFLDEWPGLVQRLPQLQVPVLLVQSRHDRVVPASSSDLFREHAGSLDLTQLWLEDSGHVATLDHDAPLLLEQTARFVERVAGR